MAVIIAALGLMTLPINLTGYRERGILRRLRASSVSTWILVSAQLTLALVTFVAGALVMGIVASVRLRRDAAEGRDRGRWSPSCSGRRRSERSGCCSRRWSEAVAPHRASASCCSSRLWLISGTAPPRAVLPSGLRDVGGALPLAHLVTAVQDPWFGFGWNTTDLAVLAAYALAAGAPALWFFRWD